MPQDLHQEIQFDAPADTVYDALMDESKHAAFTDSEARIAPVPGGAVSAWGGYIEGWNADLVPGERIVQAWRASDWPDGAWSIATFTFTDLPEGRCLLSFHQSGVPDDFATAIAQGWHDYYWTPLAAWLAGG